jgi:hypothetical protein
MTLAQIIERYEARRRPIPPIRTTTLTPLGEAIVLARRTGRAVAALPTALERVEVLNAVSSSALEVIRAEAPPAA